MANTIQFTPIGKSYLYGSGIYNDEYHELYDSRVPASGCAKTLLGELIRAVSRLGYDYYNNGNCNAADIDYTEEIGYEDEETGEWIVEQEEEKEVTIATFYQEFIDLIHDTLIKVEDDQLDGIEKTIADVCQIIIDNGYDCRNHYKPEDNNIYDRLTDYVVYFVMNHPEVDCPLSEVAGYGNYKQE